MAFGTDLPLKTAPSRSIPVPDTVSPQMKRVLAREQDPKFNDAPIKLEGWKAKVAAAAGVEAVLQVWEGQSHTQYMADIEVPKTKEYHDKVSRFFDQHLD